MAQEPWQQYLSVATGPQEFLLSRARCAAALVRQRQHIARLVDALEPENVTCLGAGYLNDIPVERLFTPTRQTVLVDWLSGATVQGIRGQLLNTGPNDQPACLFCDHDAAAQYCDGFRAPVAVTARVCSAYMPADGPVTSCGSYAPGIKPLHLTADVTAGIASAFATRVAPLMAQCRSAAQAFERAGKIAERLRPDSEFIPLASASQQLITSSMVASQFDYEPYTYFATQLERRFGREQLLSQSDRLVPMMRDLRRILFRKQLEGHLREVYRLLDKTIGRFYFSVELFRAELPQMDHYYVVPDMGQALDMLDRWFMFEFESIPIDQTLVQEPMGDGTSIIQNYVLRPRPAAYDA